MGLQRGRPKGDVIKFDIEQAWEIYQEVGSLAKTVILLNKELEKEDSEIKVKKSTLQVRLIAAGYQLHPEGGRKQEGTPSNKERVAQYRKQKKLQALLDKHPEESQKQPHSADP